MKHYRVGFALPESGHAVRGTGFYSKQLLDGLLANPDFEVIPFSNNVPDQLDLVHYPYFDMFFHTLPITKPCPAIVSILDVTPLEFSDHYPLGFQSRLNLNLQKLALTWNVRKVITISDYCKIQIPKYLPVSSSKISTTLLAARPIFRPLKTPTSQYKLPSKFVLYVGDIGWNKNLHVLAEACVLANIDLVIAGSAAVKTDLDLTHPELIHFRSWLDKYEAHPLIHRIGFVSDAELVNLYNLATCYIQPSIAEGFGLAVLEAMACGTPCISSSATSLPEVGGSAALYFDPHSTQQLVKHIQDLLTNPRLSKSLSHKSLAQAAQFSWKKTASQTLEVYRKAL